MSSCGERVGGRGGHPAPRRRGVSSPPPGFTLLEVMVVMGVVGLIGAFIVPRVADRRDTSLDVAARRLADSLGHARERAILGGSVWRLRLDAAAGRWALGPPGDEPGEIATTRADVHEATLPPGVRVRAVLADGVDLPARGVVVIDLDPTGDALPVRIELASRDGRTASVLLPPAAGRARVVGVEG